MKITAFQIKNYRSIVDSGKCHLSHDNITALIGQNESGKTSVLEALRSFYEGFITDDVLRSDQTFPVITCVFDLEDITLDKVIDMERIPEEIRKPLAEKSCITVVRKWNDAHKNSIYIDEPETNAFFEALHRQFEAADELITEAIPELQKQAEILDAEIAQEQLNVTTARSEVNTVHTSLGEIRRMLTKARRPDLQIEARQESETLEQKFSEAEEHLRKKLSHLEEIKKTLQEINTRLECCLNYIDVAARVSKLGEESLLLNRQIQDAEHQYELCSTEREARNIAKRIDGLRSTREQNALDFKELSGRMIVLNKTADKMLRGCSRQDAEIQAGNEAILEKNFLTPVDIGLAVFGHLPVFEFFEDFSSLLPNKIDLEDLLNENTQAEGYKAARNFLSVAGLNADFFREKNHRILKQKIENLNSDITIDFQDYWRQNVGKNDKIRLNFELEHYDYTVPEKSGKPYLEFWIKDKQERLYPKQRSRGVRWFLSFYLELKATVKHQLQNRVLLIDEPGLSLHARAQEDVLKVFEDLRENLQILYCTHSPHLIDLHKLYRIMAVQRANDEDENSETVVLDARSLNEASADTLSPIYSLMGARLNDRQFIYPKNNIVVEDAISFHYLDIMARMAGKEGEVHFIPASGSQNIPLLANLLFGWKIDFGLCLFDNPCNRQIAESIQESLFLRREQESHKKILVFNGFAGIEDLFSTIDFKRYIINQRIGITISNSEYIEANRLSRTILASEFCSRLERDNLKPEDFDEETRSNFEKLFNLIHTMNT